MVTQLHQRLMAIGRLRLIDVIARLGDIETLTKERTQLRLMPGGRISGGNDEHPGGGIRVVTKQDPHHQSSRELRKAGWEGAPKKGIGLPTAQEYIELEADQMDSEGPPATDGPDF